MLGGWGGRVLVLSQKKNKIKFKVVNRIPLPNSEVYVFNIA